MNHLEYNRDAWNRLVDIGDRWTRPVSREDIARARQGQLDILLTADTPIPLAWLEPLAGRRTLALAGSGGQQAPLLAAAGARVTVFDLSPRQLGQDRLVAEREGLEVTTELGDMADLSRFAPGSFDLVVNPCSTCFVPDVRRVYREVARILAPSGVFVTGFLDPACFLFDDDPSLVARISIPYSDLETASPERKQALLDKGEPLVWSHTLEAFIGGQLEAGLSLTHLLQDGFSEHPLSQLTKPMFATRAVKR